jgi:hypothetical protein
MQPKEHIWGKIWNPKLWLKVSLFLWLIVQNRILTWDNLQNEVLWDLRYASSVRKQEETMEHILNQCAHSEVIWDMAAQIMHRSNRNKASIVSTIENWDSIAYQNPILDHIWKLLPGFIVWKIWKERNK